MDKSRREIAEQKNASRTHDKVSAAMGRLSVRIHGVRLSRDKMRQEVSNYKKKKVALVKSGRWDLRTPTINLLSKGEKKRICINNVLERIKTGGKYSDLSLIGVFRQTTCAT